MDFGEDTTFSMTDTEVVEQSNIIRIISAVSPKKSSNREISNVETTGRKKKSALYGADLLDTNLDIDRNDFPN
ncbi:MAG: hypothetical protein IPP15_21010 [Saprospiraceae bacterium]|uniref:Uncharacterized protein n=1 Tax=Candidatus Opimibacter skivensis TaxID=2982028 RepID=A0A9D7SX12_9BACT|nr:hypothetical protein [Candidatus Opimibacter skivensis]